MKKYRLWMIVAISFFIIERPVFADAGPIHIAIFPMYFIFVGFLVVLFGVINLIRVFINLAELAKLLDAGDKKKSYIKVGMGLFTLAIILGLVDLIINKTILILFIIIATLSPVMGIALGYLTYKFSKDSKLLGTGKSILKYSGFIICLDIIFILGWWKCLSYF